MAEKVIDSMANDRGYHASDVILYLHNNNNNNNNITQLFSYWPYIKHSVDNYPRLCHGHLSTFGFDIRADMKTAV